MTALDRIIDVMWSSRLRPRSAYYLFMHPDLLAEVVANSSERLKDFVQEIDSLTTLGGYDVQTHPCLSLSKVQILRKVPRDPGDYMPFHEVHESGLDI